MQQPFLKSFFVLYVICLCGIMEWNYFNGNRELWGYFLGQSRRLKRKLQKKMAIVGGLNVLIVMR